MNSTRVQAFRCVIDKNPNTTRQEFLDTVGDLNFLFSAAAAHKLAGFVQLPEQDDYDAIQEMFKSFGLPPDDSKVACVGIFLSAFKVLPTPSVCTSTSPSYTTTTYTAVG